METAVVERGSLLSPPVMTRTGYVLDGWYILPDGLPETEDEDETGASESGPHDAGVGGDDFVGSVKPSDRWENLLDRVEVSNGVPNLWDVAVDRAEDDVTLCAKWKPREDVILLDPNGGYCETEETTVWFDIPFGSMTVRYDDSYTLPTPKRAGYRFAGWYFAGNLYSGTQLWQGNPTSAEYVLFKAKWTTFSHGTTMEFGSYEQDNIYQNGHEPIEWVVVDARDGAYLLLSRYILDAGPLHTDPAVVPWRDCTLRDWLNGPFLETAFTVEERARIQVLPQTDTETADRIFLLSDEEVETYLLTLDERYGRGTAYAKAQGLIVCNGDPKNPQFSWWWTRSNRAVGTLQDGGASAGNSGRGMHGIRPALWVKIE